MKKITFVEKDDDTSYDPVSTFFSKKKTPSLAKSPNYVSRQTASSTKTPIQKMQAKKQQKNQQYIAQLSIAQKIGQKGGSGYIPKKVPNYNSTSNDKLKQQTIYDLNQKQTIEDRNKNIKKINNQIKKNQVLYKKPDMVFDVPKLNYDEEDDFQQIKEQLNNQKSSKEIRQHQQQKVNQNQRNAGKLPQIKSPNINNLNQKAKTQNNSSQQRIKVENPIKNIKQNVKLQQNPKSSIKDKFSRQQKQSSQINRNQEQIQDKNIKNNKNRNENNNKKLSSTKQIQNNQNTKKPQQQPKQGNKNTNLQQRIKQLQTYEKQYISKIQYLEQRIQNLTKSQQKYTKLLKQHKLCQQNNKEFNNLSQQLNEAKQSINRLMNQPSTPYTKKRQHLLLNQINQLKKTNRQLVLRIKNYKGTDFVEMSISRNKQQICRQYEIDYKQQFNKLNVQIQSQLSKLIEQVYQYLSLKSGRNKKSTKQQFSFDKQQKFLLQINNIAQKLSMIYLQKYQVSPLPKCNQDAINLYAQIQKYKQNIFNSFKQSSIVNKQDINFAITQNNLQILNDLQLNNQQIQQLSGNLNNIIKPQQKQKRPSTSHGSSNNKSQSKQLIKKLQAIIQIFKKRSNISTGFHIQSICYFTYLKQSIQYKLNKLQTEIVNLYGRLKQMHEIYNLGGNTAKQTLYYFLQSNLQNFCLIVPNLSTKIKQIKSFYNQISKGLYRKMEIKQLQ